MNSNPLGDGADSTSSQTPEAPSRRQAVVRTATSSIVLRGVSLACTLVQIRLIMPYLGADRFGFWTVLMAIGTFFGISDLGISSAFQNDVTRADARGERARLRPMFFTAQAALLLLALAGAAIFIGVAATIGKVTFFRNLAPDLAHDAVRLTTIFVITGALNAPLALSGRLAFGLHLGHMANLTTMWAQLLTLAAMAGTVLLRAPFAIFLLASLIPTLCCNAALGLRILGRLDPSPGRNWAGMAYARHTVRTGVQFFALGASQPLFFTMGPLLLATAFGPAVVTAYGLATRALGVVHNLEVGILGATWPVITESLGRGDFGRARRWMRRNVLIACFAFCLPALLFPFIGPRILALWSGLSEASFPAWIVWPATLLYFCMLLLSPFYIGLSAAGSVTILTLAHVAAAGAAFGAAAIWRSTPEAIPTIVAAAFAIFGLLPIIAWTRRIFRPPSGE